MKLFKKFIIFLVIFSSCHKQAPPKAAQQLHVNIPADPPTFDPRRGADIISSLFHVLLFDGLYRWTPDGRTVPSLAKRHDLSADRKVYTFYLKQATWSNGTMITAYDFERSWKAILHPAFPAANAHLLYPIVNAEKAKRGIVGLDEVGIESLDELTLRVTLEHPTPYFLELIAFCLFYPQPAWQQEQAVSSDMICSGPYCLKSWKSKNEIVLEKNSHYHKQDNVLIKRIQYSIINDEMTALYLFEKKELDILGYPLQSLPPDAIKDLQKRNVISTYPLASTTFCVFNVNKPPFNNINIRKAFSYAIDRGQIVTYITQLGELPALNMIPPILKKNHYEIFFEDATGEKALSYLKKGLEQLGLTSLPEITYYYQANSTHQQVAEALQMQWKQRLGVNVKLEKIEHKILLDKLTKRDFIMAQSFWVAQYNDQMNLLERFKFKHNAKNYSGWENPLFIQLLEASILAENEVARFQVLEKAERLFIEEMPIAPLFHSNASYLVQPYVKNFYLAPHFEQVVIDHSNQIALNDE